MLAQQPDRPQQVRRPRQRARTSPRRCCSARPTGRRPDCARRPTTPSSATTRRSRGATSSYWKQLAKDTVAAAGDPKALQGAALRTWDASAKSFTIGGGAKATSWFSPNTPKLRRAAGQGEAPARHGGSRAADRRRAARGALSRVLSRARRASRNWAAAAQKANKDLFVRGCVTHPSAAESFYYDLHGGRAQEGGGRRTRASSRRRRSRDNIPPAGRRRSSRPASPSTHDKIIVVDPFSPDCAVVTGSHNLGHKASFNNDENLVIVRGQRAARRGLRDARARHLRPLLVALDHPEPGTGRAPRRCCRPFPTNGRAATSTPRATSRSRSCASG